MPFRKRSTGTDRSAALRKVSLFDDLSDAELHRVAELGEEVWAEPGAVLIDQGKVGQECFVIIEGDVGVYIGTDQVATLHAGDMVGEMALIDHRPRNATVTASTPLQLLSFDTKRFRTLLDELPSAAEKVDALLHERARANESS
jgi:CRP-like cAMP-binding protein